MHWILTPEAQISRSSSTRFAFRDTRLSKIRNVPNYLEHPSKVRGNCSFRSPYMFVNVKFTGKSQNIGNSKFQNPKQYFMRTIEKKAQEKFGIMQKRFEKGLSFWNFLSYTVPFLTKRKTKKKKKKKHIMKNRKLKISTHPKQYFWVVYWEENSGQVLNNLKTVWGRCILLKFCSFWVPC